MKPRTPQTSEQMTCALAESILNARRASESADEKQDAARPSSTAPTASPADSGACAKDSGTPPTVPMGDRPPDESPNSPMLSARERGYLKRTARHAHLYALDLSEAVDGGHRDTVRLSLIHGIDSLNRALQLFDEEPANPSSPSYDVFATNPNERFAKPKAKRKAAK